MMNISAGAFSILACLLTTACATVSENRKLAFTLQVDSISDSTDYPKFLEIRSGSKLIFENDLRFKEFSSDVSNAFRVKGMKPATDLSKPHLVVILDYGVSEPDKNLETYTVATYHGPTTTTFQNSTGKTLGNITSNPASPITYENQLRQTTSYKHFITMTAYEISTSKMGQPDLKSLPMRWQTKIESISPDDDLRALFPILLVGAMKDIAGNTHLAKPSRFLISRRDPRLCIIVSGENCDLSKYDRPRANEGELLDME